MGNDTSIVETPPCARNVPQVVTTTTVTTPPPFVAAPPPGPLVVTVKFTKFDLLYPLARAVDTRTGAQINLTRVRFEEIIAHLEAAGLPPMNIDIRIPTSASIRKYLRNLTERAISINDRDTLSVLARLDLPIISERLMGFALQKKDNAFAKYIIEEKAYKEEGFCGLCMAITAKNKAIIDVYLSPYHTEKFGPFPPEILNTALMTAISVGDVITARQLISRGADVNYHVGKTSAIKEAIGNPAMVTLLVDSELDTTSADTYEAVKKAIKKNDHASLALLLSEGARRSDDKTNIWGLADMRGDLETIKIVQRFAEKGAAEEVESRVVEDRNESQRIRSEAESERQEQLASEIAKSEEKTRSLKEIQRSETARSLRKSSEAQSRAKTEKSQIISEIARSEIEAEKSRILSEEKSRYEAERKAKSKLTSSSEKKSKSKEIIEEEEGPKKSKSKEIIEEEETEEAKKDELSANKSERSIKS